jgi:hypothetical protein
MSKRMNWRLMAVLLAAGALGGCYSQLRLSPDYGVAVRQDVTAQIADPDAHYTGVPQPGSNPNRVAQAQRRYNTGRVIQPASTSTSTVAAGGGDGGGGNGGGGNGGGGGGTPAGP